MKIFLSHLTAVRSVNKLGPSNLHPLAYQLDGYLSPVTSSQEQVQKFLLTILGQTFSTSASAVGLAGNLLHMHNLISCEYTLRK